MCGPTPKEGESNQGRNINYVDRRSYGSQPYSTESMRAVYAEDRADSIPLRAYTEGRNATTTLYQGRRIQYTH